MNVLLGVLGIACAHAAPASKEVSDTHHPGLLHVDHTTPGLGTSLTKRHPQLFDGESPMVSTTIHANQTSSIGNTYPVGETWRGIKAQPWYLGKAIDTSNAGTLPLYAGSVVGRPDEESAQLPTSDQLGKNPTQLTQNSDYSWSVAARIGGNTNQYLTFLVDTGHNNTWAPALQGNITGHQKASLSGEEAEPFTISYGLQSVTGHYLLTSFHIAGLSVRYMTLGLAETESPFFYDMIPDGILGLGYNMESTSLMRQLISTNTISAPEFALYIDPAKKRPNLQFGGHDSSLYEGNLTFIDIDTDTNHWAIPFQSINGHNTSGVAILDSSAQSILLSPSQFSVAFPQAKPIPSSSTTFTLGCDDPLPSLSFMFNSINVTFDPEDLFIGRDPNDHSRCVLGVFQQENSTSDSSRQLAVLGMPFFKAVYSVFSYSHNGHPAVGIAPVVHGYDASAAQSFYAATEYATILSFISMIGAVALISI